MGFEEFTVNLPGIGTGRWVIDKSQQKAAWEMYVELDSWNGADIFRGDGYGAVLVTERAKLWLQEHFEGYVEFQEFNCK